MRPVHAQITKQQTTKRDYGQRYARCVSHRPEPVRVPSMRKQIVELFLFLLIRLLNHHLLPIQHVQIALLSRGGVNCSVRQHHERVWIVVVIIYSSSIVTPLLIRCLAHERQQSAACAFLQKLKQSLGDLIHVRRRRRKLLWIA